MDKIRHIFSISALESLKQVFLCRISSSRIFVRILTFAPPQKLSHTCPLFPGFSPSKVKKKIRNCGAKKRNFLFPCHKREEEKQEPSSLFFLMMLITIVPMYQKKLDYAPVSFPPENYINYSPRTCGKASVYFRCKIRTASTLLTTEKKR